MVFPSTTIEEVSDPSVITVVVIPKKLTPPLTAVFIVSISYLALLSFKS